MKKNLKRVFRTLSRWRKKPSGRRKFLKFQKSGRLRKFAGIYRFRKIRRMSDRLRLAKYLRVVVEPGEYG